MKQFSKALLSLSIAAVIAGCSDNTTQVSDELLTSPEVSSTELNRLSQAIGRFDLSLSASPELTVDAGILEYSDSNSLFAVGAKVVNTQGVEVESGIDSYWMQTSGPNAYVLSPNTLNSNILLPSVDAPTDLAFRVYTVNAEGQVAYDDLVVTALPLDGRFRVTSQVVDESAGLVEFTVTSSTPLSENVTFNYSTETLDATAGRDYDLATGQLVLEAGSQRASVIIGLRNDQITENNEAFNLVLVTTDDVDPVRLQATAVIQDNETGFVGSTTAPVALGQSDISKVDLNVADTTARIHLTWANADTDLRMVITDPCDNVLDSDENIATPCQGYSADIERSATAPYESVFWVNRAPRGRFKIDVEHLSGDGTVYTLRIFSGDESQMFVGDISNGDLVEVFDGDVVTNIPPEIVSLPDDVTVVLPDEVHQYQIIAVDEDSTEEIFTYNALSVPEGISVDRETGIVSGTPSAEWGLPLTSQNQHCGVVTTFSQAVNQAIDGAADVLIAIDESGSMSTEHAWVGPMIANLEQGLLDESVGASNLQNLYGMVGFYIRERPRNITLDDGTNKVAIDQFPLLTDALQLSGGTEDGYHAIQVLFEDYELRPQAATNIILITDEDRDIVDETLTYESILTQLNVNNATLNAVVSARFECGDGRQAIGIDSLGAGYVADGQGDFERCSGATVVSGANTTVRDYVDLAMDNSGAAWDLNILRGGGLPAESFSKAFVAIKVQEIIQRLALTPLADVVVTHAEQAGSQVTATVKNRGGLAVEGAINVSAAHSVDGVVDQEFGTGSITGLAPGEEKTVVISVDPAQMSDALQLTVTSSEDECITDNNTSIFPVIRVEAVDSASGAGEQTYVLNVIKEESAPVITSAATATVKANEAFQFTVEATDADVGETLRYALSNAPRWLKINTYSGEVNIPVIPDQFELAEYDFSVVVVDIAGHRTEQAFKLVIDGFQVQVVSDTVSF